MDNKEKIIEYLKKKPAKAWQIATEISVPKAIVNSILYSHKPLFVVDENFVWRLKNADVSFENGISLIGVKVIHTAPIKTMSYGEGEVVEFNGSTIRVKFDSNTVSFVYPAAFAQSLKAKDVRIHENIKAQLNKTGGHVSTVEKSQTPPLETSAVEQGKRVISVKRTPVVTRAAGASVGELGQLFDELRLMEQDFLQKYDVDDIYSNSKIYEILIANHFGHYLIPGHSGSRDARDSYGNEIEYKHYKESSKNHTWTFNDFSDETIDKLRYCSYVYFVYVDDVNYPFPGQIKWAYIVKGTAISAYLAEATQKITNKRKMINVSSRQLESFGCKRTTYADFDLLDGTYGADLQNIIDTISRIEKITGVTGLLTSNKIWELMIGLELNHTVNSEQGGRAGAHDASDSEGHLFEYKVSKTYSWNFQDISENVLNKYYNDYRIILAVVDKTALRIEAIYSASPEYTVPLLRKKLQEKTSKHAAKGKELRRLQVSLSKGDLKLIRAEKIY